MTNSDALAGVVARVEKWLQANGWEGDEEVFVDSEAPSWRKDEVTHGDLRAILAALAEARKERDQLAEWKASAMEVLGAWDEVWVAAGKPGPLGGSKAIGTLAAVNGMREFATQVHKLDPIMARMIAGGIATPQPETPE